MSTSSSVPPHQPCVRCDTLDSPFVSLDCRHHFCLVCMSYLYIKCRAHDAISDIVQCSECNQCTRLDSPTVHAIKATIEDTLLPNLNSFEIDSQSGPQERRPEPRPNDPPTEPKNHASKYSKRHSDGTTLEDEDGTKSRHPGYDSPSRERLALAHGLCTIHTFEELGFVCYTCSNYELCAKCVSARHKSHQIRSLRQAMELEAEELTRQRQDNDEKIHFIRSRERRIEDQRQAAQNKWARVKDQIGDAFGQLRMKIRQREAELVETCEEHYKTLEHMLERQLRRLQGQLVFLLNFQEQFKTLQNYDPKNCRPDCALDYFSMCLKLKSKLGDSTSRIDESLKQPVITPYIELDQRQLLPILESIQSIQLTQMAPTEITRLNSDKYSSLNTSRERTRFADDSLGFITKRRTEMMLETMEKMSQKKGVDTNEKNFPSYVSKFLEKHNTTKQQPVMRVQRNSTKVLSKASFELTKGKNKKQLNITKEGGEHRAVTQVSSPVFRLNYKAGTFSKKKG